jgi:hypothetical protein
MPMVHLIYMLKNLLSKAAESEEASRSLRGTSSV